MEDVKIPLCVDLDGTLIRTDLLMECLLGLLKRKPWLVFLVPVWLSQGKGTLKQELANRVDLNVQTLPYQQELLNFLREEYARGRPLMLATASHRKLAERVASHLGIFSKVYATENGINLTGREKRDILVKNYGVKGFDYAGNAKADLPVWAMARQAFVVNPNPNAGVLADVTPQCPVSRTFLDPPAGLKPYAKALRVHQWLKNLLVFVPMVLAHQIGEARAWINAAWAFLSFSLCASSVYLLNDLLDLADDRLHPRKRLRPLASGQISIVHGLVLIPLLLLGAFIIAYEWLSPLFLVILAIYYLLTLSYSLLFKAVVLLDTLVLAGLYTLRIIGGTVATHVGASFWLLSFSIFLFFSLALVKRYSELLALRQRGQLTAHGRGYHVEDLTMLLAFGIASGFMAVLVSALYINSEQVKLLYRHPSFLWLVSPILLYWISRIWLITHRGGMHDDPVVFTVKDKGSWAVAVAIGTLLLLAAR